MTTIHGILTTAALCLAAGLSTSCQSVSAEIPADRYVRQMPYSPLRDAELEKSSRKLVEELQLLARSCKSVRLVIKWCMFTGGLLNGTQVPMSESETAELLSLIGRIQPVKPDLCACVDPAYALELQFIMADGSIRKTPFPSVTRLSRVSSDGYAFMCSMALPDADAERLDKLAKHEWVHQKINETRKRYEIE